MTFTDPDTFTDNADRNYGQDPDLTGLRTRTDIWTLRLINGLRCKAMILFFIAWLCIDCIFLSCVLNNVKYSFRWCKYSFLIYISHNFLQHNVFYFNTPIYMYLNPLSHVFYTFYLPVHYTRPVIGKKYLPSTICIDLHLTVRLTCLIDIHLIDQLFLWFTHSDKNIPVIDLFLTTFTPYKTLSKKYLNGAVKIIVTYLYVYIRLINVSPLLVRSYCNFLPQFYCPLKYTATKAQIVQRTFILLICNLDTYLFRGFIFGLFWPSYNLPVRPFHTFVPLPIRPHYYLHVCSWYLSIGSFRRFVPLLIRYCNLRFRPFHGFASLSFRLYGNFS